MNFNEKFGIILILMGIFFPILLFPLSEGYESPHIYSSIFNSWLYCLPSMTTHFIITFPYKYGVALGMILVFTGFLLFTLSRFGQRAEK